MITFLASLSTILVMVSVILIAEKKVIGQVLMVITEVTLLIYYSMTSQYILVLQALFLGVISLRAAIRWYKGII